MIEYHEHCESERQSGICSGCGEYCRDGCHVTRRLVVQGAITQSVPEIWHADCCPCGRGKAQDS